MIHIKNISKTFKVKNNTFKALDNVTLSIEKNSIHGIIGPSGAGKSTLIRVINQLEVHDSGSVSVFDYKDLRRLNKESTRMYRKQVSMIFQRFNLLDRKTVFENIALPITFNRKLTEADKDKIQKLIELVELDGYQQSLPSQLSGGQQQRVGIARALVNNPEILLCDEPTSALDPLTISSILDLIKRIKEELQLTVIVVTHDMNVIKDICERVTVMSNGKIIEEDTIDNIIFQPKTELTKQLLGTVGFNLDDVIKHFEDKDNLYLLKFSEDSKQQTIISAISRECAVHINILYANITPSDKGIMLVRLETKEVSKINNTLFALEYKGVEVRHVS